jgi:translation initiation factor 2 subunit 1
LKRDGFKGDWLNDFATIAKENISIPFVEIRGYITINSWLPDGINHIRTALSKAEQSEYEDVDIKIKYIGAPQYLINVKAPDYKIAENEMKKAVERAKEYIKSYNGNCEFNRKVDE